MVPEKCKSDEANLNSCLAILAELLEVGTVNPRELEPHDRLMGLSEAEFIREMDQNARPGLPLTALELCDSFHLEELQFERPTLSYVDMIYGALLSEPAHQMKLDRIYDWIMEKYPYFRSANKNWKVCAVRRRRALTQGRTRCGMRCRPRKCSGGSTTGPPGCAAETGR